MDDERERIKEQIRRAFVSAKRPPNGSLHGSIEGDEPLLLEADFQDKHDWRALDGANTRRFRNLAPEQVAAVIAYLEYAAEHYEFGREEIDQALANYWRPRLRSLTGG
jgi:hypothetical protein